MRLYCHHWPGPELDNKNLKHLPWYLQLKVSEYENFFLLLTKQYGVYSHSQNTHIESLKIINWLFDIADDSVLDFSETNPFGDVGGSS